MIVARHDVLTERTQVLKQVNRRARWLVKLYATDGEQRNVDEIRPRDAMYLTELLPTALETAADLCEGLEVVTAAGFTVHLLR